MNVDVGVESGFDEGYKREKAKVSTLLLTPVETKEEEEEGISMS